MVTHGTTITFTVNGTTGSLLPRSVDSVRAIVVDRLAAFFDVQDVTFLTDSVWSDPFHALSNWPYSASVRAKTRIDYGDIRDIDSIVANAFYNATGSLPTVTADNLESGQGTPDNQRGPSTTTVLILAAVVLALVVAVKVT